MRDLRDLRNDLTVSLSATGRDAPNGAFKEIVIELLWHVEDLEGMINNHLRRIEDLETELKAVRYDMI